MPPGNSLLTNYLFNGRGQYIGESAHVLRERIVLAAQGTEHGLSILVMNSTFVPSFNPRRRRTSTGIVTCPLLLTVLESCILYL